jgi:hypothetical protein
MFNLLLEGKEELLPFIEKSKGELLNELKSIKNLKLRMR